jgi:hypothetical protein
MMVINGLDRNFLKEPLRGGVVLHPAAEHNWPAAFAANNVHDSNADMWGLI